MSLAAELVRWARERGYEPQRHNYGPDVDQVADLTVPLGSDRHPVAVFIHGGFWRPEFDRTLMNALAADFAGRGWATWNVEYRRGPGSGGDGRCLADVRAAVSLLRLIPEPLDLKRLVVVGHSAGGQLALVAAPDLEAGRVVSLAGVADLLAAARDGLGQDAVQEFIGADSGADPAAYAALDPLERLPTGTRTLLVHGDADDRVPVSQSRTYRDAASAVGDDCELIELAGEGHFSLIDPRTPACRRWIEAIDAGGVTHS